MKKKILSHLLCSALVILCSALMPILLFFQNVGSVKFYEIAIFIGIYSVIGLLIFWILKLILRSEYKAAVAAGFIALLFQNAGRLSALMSYKFVLIIFVVTVGILILVARKFLKEEIASTFVPVLSVVLTIFIMFNTVMSIGNISSAFSADSEAQNDLNKQYEYVTSFKNSSKTSEKLPNIYFIIPDEYAGFSSLKKYYNYDNSEFEDFLNKNNFTISKSSTNYFHATMECLANVFNFEFSTKNIYNEESEFYCKEKVSNGVLFRLAEENGYTINVAQTMQLVDYKSTTEIYGDKWSQTQDSESVIDLMVTPSMFVPFTDRIRAILNGVSADYFEGHSHIANQAQACIDPLLYFSESQNVGKPYTFNLCYVSNPHPPFFFDQEGSLYKDYSHLHDWVDRKYYLNQLKHCTTLIQNAIDNIIKNDPDSIIILMSDHGVRDHYTGDSEHEWMKPMTVKDHTDILCAVYYKGEAISGLEGMCGSNVLISIVNKAWGYNIPLVEQSDDMYQYYKVPDIL